jgi:hypothetical protein
MGVAEIFFGGAVEVAGHPAGGGERETRARETGNRVSCTACVRQLKSFLTFLLTI